MRCSAFRRAWRARARSPRTDRANGSLNDYSAGRGGDTAAAAARRVKAADDSDDDAADAAAADPYARRVAAKTGTGNDFDNLFGDDDDDDDGFDPFKEQKSSAAVH